VCVCVCVRLLICLGFVCFADKPQKRGVRLGLLRDASAG
jgi:hypothetical protein